MGLVTGILALPLAPFRGTTWVLDEVLIAAEREHDDPEPVRRPLAAFVDDRANGGVDADEFDRREDELLDRLDEIEAYRRRLNDGS